MDMIIARVVSLISGVSLGAAVVPALALDTPYLQPKLHAFCQFGPYDNVFDKTYGPVKSIARTRTWRGDKPNNEGVTKYDQNGRPIEYSNSEWGESYAWKDGVLVSTEFFKLVTERGKSNKVVEKTITYSNDDQGRPIKYTVEKASGDRFDTVYVEYQGIGTRSEVCRYPNSNETTTTKYNELGFPLDVVRTKKDGTPGFQESYSYRQESNGVMRVTDSKSVTWYNSQGLPIEQARVSNGKVTSREFYKYTFDKYGNWLSLEKQVPVTGMENVTKPLWRMDRTITYFSTKN